MRVSTSFTPVTGPEEAAPGLAAAAGTGAGLVGRRPGSSWLRGLDGRHEKEMGTVGFCMVSMDVYGFLWIFLRCIFVDFDSRERLSEGFF